MTLTLGSNTDKRVFPLQGIGDYFSKIGKLSHAKHAYKKAIDSSMASDIDKANAKYSIKKLDEKLREKEEQVVDVTTSVMLPVKDLKPHPEIQMPIGSQDYKRLLEDIAERGIKTPLVINTQNLIIDGINRWKIAKELEIENVPCSIVGAITIPEVRRFAIASNLCRRHLSQKEKKVWIVELLRLRKEEVNSIRGRKKGGKRRSGGDQLSNKEISEIAGVDHKIVDRLEDKTLGRLVEPTTSFIKTPRNFVKEDFKEQISWGKSNRADESFANRIAQETKNRIDHIRANSKKGQRLTVEVIFQYDEYL